MDKSTIIGGVVGGLFGPIGFNNTTRSPSVNVGGPGKHKVARAQGIRLRIGNMPASAVHEFGSVLPKTSQIIVVIRGSNWVGLVHIGSVGGVRIVEKTAHAKAFVVDDSVAVSNPVQRLIFSNSKSIVNAIVVLVRSFKEIYANGRRRIPVTFKT